MHQPLPCVHCPCCYSYDYAHINTSHCQPQLISVAYLFLQLEKIRIGFIYSASHAVAVLSITSVTEISRCRLSHIVLSMPR